MKKTQRNAKICAVVLIDGAFPSGIQVQFLSPKSILGVFWGPMGQMIYNSTIFVSVEDPF